MNFQATENLIGTNGDGVNDTAERNDISGNTSWGIEISDPGTDNNVVAGNLIGTAGHEIAAVPERPRRRGDHPETGPDRQPDRHRRRLDRHSADEANVISGSRRRGGIMISDAGPTPTSWPGT